MRRIQIGGTRVGALLGLAALALAAWTLCLPDGHAASGTDVGAVVSQSRAPKSGDDFLPPEQAFQLSASADGANTVRLDWLIAPGYYLYRDRIKTTSEAGADALGTPVFPAGQVKQDEYFGEQVVYHDEVVVLLPVKRSGGGELKLPLSVTYQGCAEAGLCYPPITKVLFPITGSPAIVTSVPPPLWESTAIVVGAGAFLLAGLVLRKGRKLDTPA